MSNTLFVLPSWIWAAPACQDHPVGTRCWEPGQQRKKGWRRKRGLWIFRYFAIEMWAKISGHFMHLIRESQHCNRGCLQWDIKSGLSKLGWTYPDDQHFQTVKWAPHLPELWGLETTSREACILLSWELIFCLNLRLLFPVTKKEIEAYSTRLLGFLKWTKKAFCELPSLTASFVCEFSTPSLDQNTWFPGCQGAKAEGAEATQWDLASQHWDGRKMWAGTLLARFEIPAVIILTSYGLSRTK